MQAELSPDHLIASTMPSHVESRLARLARLMLHRRRLVLTVWVTILALAILGGPRIAGDWTADYGTPGSDSAAVAATLDQRFPELSAHALDVVWRAPDGALAPEPRAHIEGIVRALGAIPGVEAADLREARISADRTVGLLELPLVKRPGDIASDDGPAVLAVANSASQDSVTVHFGGFVMEQVERGSVSSEGIGLAVALLILLFTFGTVIAAGLPIATALFGIATGSAVVGATAALVDTPDWAASVAAMVGLGVGIDYALLILTRYREQLDAGARIGDALAAALSTAGRSVLVAGGTVVVALLGLLLMRLPYLNGVAVAASASVLLVMVASLTLLPALLGFAGMKVNALALPGRRRHAGSQFTQAASTSTGAGFARWSRLVQRHPWLATTGGVLVVVVLAAPVTGVRLGFPGPANQPEGTQSRAAFELATAGFGAGAGGPLRIVTPVSMPGDRPRIDALRRAIALDPMVAGVSDITLSADRTTAMLAVQSRSAPDSAAATELLGRLRDAHIPASQLRAKVGGPTALTRDQAHATATRLPALFLGVTGLSALLLLVAFRSVLIPVKAAAMNLLSIAAAYGVVAIVAEGGAIGQLVGIDGEVPIPPFIPVLMFAILFGLSMDYEVFLLGRMRELWLEFGDAGRAVTEGVATTARVITSAAAIMIAVFGAFAASDQVFLKLIGIGMASAILIDATVIRLLLVPAIMGLLDRHAWWLPAWLDRALPQANLETPCVPAGHTSPAEEPTSADADGGAGEPLAASGATN